MCFSPVVFIFTITLLGFGGGGYPGMDQSLHPAPSQSTRAEPWAHRSPWRYWRRLAEATSPSPSLAVLPRLLQQGATNTGPTQGRALLICGHPQAAFAGPLCISIAQSWAHPCTHKPSAPPALAVTPACAAGTPHTSALRFPVAVSVFHYPENTRCPQGQEGRCNRNSLWRLLLRSSFPVCNWALSQ